MPTALHNRHSTAKGYVCYIAVRGGQRALQPLNTLGREAVSPTKSCMAVEKEVRA